MTTAPFQNHGAAINNGVQELLKILHHDVAPRVIPRQTEGNKPIAMSDSPPRVNNKPDSLPRVKHKPDSLPRVTTSERNDWTSKASTIYSNGTIVRKRFNDGKYYEGEVTKYDEVNRYYLIKYLGGQQEDLDENDMKRYYKRRQQYSAIQYKNKALNTYQSMLNKTPHFNYSLFPSPKQRPTTRTKLNPWKTMHAAAGFLVKSTWLRAIKKENFATWPGLIYSNA